MLYKKYPLYENALEIMIPSTLEPVPKVQNGKKNTKKNRLGDKLLTQYSWISEDRKVAVNITKGYSLLSENDIVDKLQEYYSIYKRDLVHFGCKKISLIEIEGKKYGQLIYTSEMMGYSFYSVLLIGTFQEGELILTLQCLESEMDVYEHAFSNIVNSLKDGE